ncbi:MAG: NAD(P)H-dependent oxidoreductase [Lachnospiraceae bacterium]|nr:NAD(P)H-dependent oxidoreductase [Lachnospiraceae bacterium]
MKKIIMLLTAVTLMFTLAACGSNAGKPSDGVVSDSPVQTVEPDNETGQSNQTETQNPDQEETPDDIESKENGSKALVVYFSATGNTKAVAETIAELQGADIYEIVPEQPYTDEDLNYNDRSTRATAEQNNPDARPAISGGIEDIAEYDVIYVGYPIWWGDMPRILYTFFDNYDLTGKTIAPFCTSGGSGLSGTPKTIGSLEPEADILDGLHVSDSAAGNAEDKVSEWLGSIGQAE